MILEDREHCGRLFEVGDHLVKAIIEDDPHKTTREVAQELGIGNSTVVRHLEKYWKCEKVEVVGVARIERAPEKPPF
ncbi:hypothetical protein RB195_025517 [Necator americanus]|uniref:Mos1 transposase HTH domain-containing protein n=1 Tax=Necator americanus TaxID=51031 RepID=A0ABR1ESN0_NECAM